MRIRLNAQVRCVDGPFGELVTVVLDPRAWRLTHLVVQPHGGHGLGRLVPAGLGAGEQDGGDELSLTCRVADVEALETVQEVAYLRLGERAPTPSGWDVGIEDPVAAPAYSATGVDPMMPDPDPHVELVYDRIPAGMAEVRHVTPVTSADGHGVGRVDGFLVDGDSSITHLVLRHGHLWQRHALLVPVAQVQTLQTDAVTLALSSHEVSHLGAGARID